MVCVNSVIGKGIEPHPTNEYHSAFHTEYHSLFFLSTLEAWCVHNLWHPVMPFEWSRVRNLSPLSTYIVSNPVSIVKFYLKFLYFFFDTQHLVNTICHNGQQFLCWFFGRISFDYFIFNSLTQQVHQVSSVGAGSFPLTRDSERVLRVDSASM